MMSEGWNVCKENDVGKARFARQKILDDIWWDKIEYIISFTKPIYNMFRPADIEKPNLYLVYDMLDCVIKKVRVVIYGKEG